MDSHALRIVRRVGHGLFELAGLDVYLLRDRRGRVAGGSGRMKAEGGRMIEGIPRT